MTDSFDSEEKIRESFKRLSRHYVDSDHSSPDYEHIWDDEDVLAHEIMKRAIDELMSLRATLEILQDKETMKQLKEAEEDFKFGRTISREDLKRGK